MELKFRHPWDLSYQQAASLQQSLKKDLILTGNPSPVRTVAGIDVSYTRGSSKCFAAIVVLDVKSGSVSEEAFAEGKMAFPYIPGMLTFREGPVVLKAFENLKTVPDVLMFDGQGIAHPRRFGLAAHLGLLMDLPSIGCAKTRLTGTHEEPGPVPGDFTPLMDDGEKIGAVLRTKKNVKPVFVSQGHKVSLKSAISIVMKTTSGYRLPEPTRQAHIAVNRYRREH